jgi:hypothetical protein
VRFAYLLGFSFFFFPLLGAELPKYRNQFPFAGIHVRNGQQTQWLCVFPEIPWKYERRFCSLSRRSSVQFDRRSQNSDETAKRPRPTGLFPLCGSCACHGLLGARFSDSRSACTVRACVRARENQAAWRRRVAESCCVLQERVPSLGRRASGRSI